MFLINPVGFLLQQPSDLEQGIENHQEIEKYEAARCRGGAGRRKCRSCRAPAGLG